MKYYQQVDLKNNERIIIPHKQILQPGEFGATISWDIREGLFDPKGKITEYQAPKRSESFTRQFLDILLLMFQGYNEANPMPIRNTSNALVNIGYTTYTWNCAALANSVLSGTVVGTGNTAPTITDYALQTLVAHGVGAGQMQYGAATFGAPASDATTSQFTITRSFANGSGGSITVNEIGLYVKLSRGAAATPNYYYFMTIRDVIGGGIAVPNGQTLTVNYRPQAVV